MAEGYLFSALCRTDMLPNTPENADDGRRNWDRKKGRGLAPGFPEDNGSLLLLVILRFSVVLTRNLLLQTRLVSTSISTD